MVDSFNWCPISSKYKSIKSRNSILISHVSEMYVIYAYTFYTSIFEVVCEKIVLKWAEKKGGYAHKLSCLWLVLAGKKIFFKPSAFESEIHPSHKSSICILCT